MRIARVKTAIRGFGSRRARDDEAPAVERPACDRERIERAITKATDLRRKR